MTKPTNTALWATTGTKTEPSSGEKAAGWSVGQKPPAQWLNWWMNIIYTWVLYLDAFEASTHSWAAQNLFLADVQINVGAGGGSDLVGLTVGGSGASAAIVAVGGDTGMGGQFTGVNNTGVKGIGGDDAFGGDFTGGVLAPGVRATGGDGSTHGALRATPGTGSHGIFIDAAASGNGDGVHGTGSGTGSGAAMVGGASNGWGLKGTGGATNGNGVLGTGAGSGTGVSGVGGSTHGIGVTGVAGTGTAIGVQGTGGSTGGAGVQGVGLTGGNGVEGVGGAGGAGVQGTGGSSAAGVQGFGGSSGGTGVFGQGNGIGIGVQGVSVLGVAGQFVGDVSNASPAHGPLCLNPLQNPPSSTVPGELAVVIVSGVYKLMMYNGSAWVSVGSQT